MHASLASLTLLVALSACSDDAASMLPDAQPAPTDASPNATDAAKVDAMLGACTTDGSRFIVSGYVDQSATDVVLWKDSGLVGVTGKTLSGLDFYFRRDGDFSDGDFEGIGDYDSSSYPYQINYIEALAGSDCSEGLFADGDCTGFQAQSGTLTVTQVTPVFQATFELGTLFKDEDGRFGPIVGETATGCISVANP